MPPRVSTPATETTPATTSATSKKPAGPRKKLQISDKARETGQITQSFSHRRTKTVQIEVKRRQPSAKNKAKPGAREAPPRPAAVAAPPPAAAPAPPPPPDIDQARALEAQKRAREEADRVARMARENKVVSEEAPPPPSAKSPPEFAPQPPPSRSARPARPAAADKQPAARRPAADAAARPKPAEKPAEKTAAAADDESKRKGKRGKQAKPASGPRKRDEPRRRAGKLTIAQALEGEEYELRMRSLAAMRRKRERERQRNLERLQEGARVVREVTLPESIEVQELALRMAERTEDVIVRLQQLGINVLREDFIDADTAEIIITEYGHRTRRVSESDIEEGLGGGQDKPEDLKPRPPVVTVMGHVDHGKTSILDAIRKSDAAAKEAGGITQHIGASFIELDDKRKVCFIDTPGHMAFTALRARGANVTDIVVLVVAADDGVKEQTREAYNHAKAAEATVIVAINKMDKPGADIEKVKRELLELGVVPEDMGGDVLVVPTSAASGEGISDLLDAIFLQGELLNLNANPNRGAQGVVLEARLEQGRGAVATILVQRGTLKVGQNFIAGTESGRVRALANWRAKRVKEALPSEPIEVIGLSDLPAAGDDFIVVESDQRASEIADARRQARRQASFVAAPRPLAADADEILRQMDERDRERPGLHLIVKADTHGSAEAVEQSVLELGDGEVDLRILHVGVGGVNESDVLLANTTGAEIVGFNVRSAPKARTLAQRDGILVHHYATIYELLDDVRERLEGRLRPKTREVVLGEAEVREVFDISRAGKVAGCQVLEGLLRRGARVRVLREGEILHDGRMRSLRRFKDEASEVRQGLECGLAFEGFQGFLAGDRVECYEVREVAKKASSSADAREGASP